MQELVTRRPDTLDAARQIASVPDPAEREELIAGVASGELTSQTVRERVSARRGGDRGTAPKARRESTGSPTSLEQVVRRVQHDVALVNSVFTTWERLLAEQPDQLEAVQEGLNAILTRAQLLMEQMENVK